MFMQIHLNRMLSDQNSLKPSFKSFKERRPCDKTFIHFFHTVLFHMGKNKREEIIVYYKESNVDVCETCQITVIIPCLIVIQISELSCRVIRIIQQS